jgi:predicted metal-dependent hydrolase
MNDFLNFQLIKSKRRRKTISLHIREGGEIVIRAPHKASKREIEEFIREREAWVVEKLTEEKERRKELQKAFVPGEKFLYLGEWYPLEIDESDHEDLPLKLSFGNFVLHRVHVDEARVLFIEWYKREAREKIEGRVRYYSDRFHLFPKGTKITGAKSRWGSCSRDNRLSFSWRIIMAPLRIIDYILVHELVHIKEKNHSWNFWAALEKILPDYRERRVWLRKNGHRLWL